MTGRRQRPDGIERALIEQLRFERSMDARLADDYLAVDYRNFLYGGWRHPKGHIVTRQHRVLIKWHEAHKVRFCPACKRCGLHNTLCKCGVKQDLCWRYIGVAPLLSTPPWNGEGEGAIRTCSEHGDWPWRKANYYSFYGALIGNGGAKTEGGAAEFAARLIGHRPWDGSITDIVHNNWLQLIICQTLSTSGKATIQPRLEKMLGSRILHKEKNSSGGIDFYWVQTPGGVDRVKIASQDQHARTSSNVSPIEGVEQANVWVDEPPDESIRGSYGRGLRFGMNYGAGVEDLTATFFEGNAEQRIFVFDHLWNMSHRRGGPEKSYFVMGGSIHDNPALTQEDKRKLILRYPLHEQKAREWGMYEELAGKVFPEYDPRIHDYDPGKRAVLVTPEGMLMPLSRRNEHPSHWPIYCIADPHDKRPWFIIWVAMDENGEWYVVEEWPKGEFHKMTHYTDAGIENRPEAYAALIKEIEEGFPGGSSRVVERFMDKRFGGQEKAGSDGLTVSESMERIGCYFSTDYKAEGRSEIMAGNTIIRELLVGTWKPGDEVTQMAHPHFHLAETCRNVRWCLQHHVHLEKSPKGQESVSEVGKDGVDCLRILGMAIRNVTTGAASEQRGRTNARMRQRGERMRAARTGGIR